jgi:hypothetical protein
VVAQPAAHVERPHTVGARVAQCHRRPGLKSWSCAHAWEDIRASSATASSRGVLLRDTVCRTRAKDLRRSFAAWRRSIGFAEGYD